MYFTPEIFDTHYTIRMYQRFSEILKTPPLNEEHGKEGLGLSSNNHSATLR